MRRASFTPIFNVSNHEPLIVVEETNAGEDDDSKQSKKSNSGESSEAESPVNPYLLSPFPDLQQRRKHSLPSLQITEGITASQVRRLSEAGSEGSALSSKDVEFLATLSQKTIPASGGRRHSIVTISPVPTSLFGRNRRESISGPFRYVVLLPSPIQLFVLFILKSKRTSIVLIGRIITKNVKVVPKAGLMNGLITFRKILTYFYFRGLLGTFFLKIIRRSGAKTSHFWQNSILRFYVLK